jgi:hypothetical protein
MKNTIKSIAAATASVVAFSTATPALAQSLSPAELMTIARAISVCMVGQGLTTFDEAFTYERQVLQARGLDDLQLMNLNQLMTPKQVDSFINRKGGCESLLSAEN